ncbi:hypothetical protein ACFL6Q_02260 [Candidatus Neomarinimicrobiota bacterium]
MKESSRFLRWFPLIILIVVLGLFSANGLILINHPEKGLYGDMFGAASALFSGLAFAGIVFAIVLQWEDIKLQREELRLSREELKGQREQLKVQNKTLKLQQFESTLFQMLRLHNNIISQMEMLKHTTNPKSGRECFQTVYTLWLRGQLKKEVDESMSQIQGLIKKAFGSIGDVFHSTLLPYFRRVYLVLEFIEFKAPIDKDFYGRLVSKELTQYERLLILYYNYSDYLPDRLRFLGYEYALFDGIAEEELPHPSHKKLLQDSFYRELLSEKHLKSG